MYVLLSWHVLAIAESTLRKGIVSTREISLDNLQLQDSAVYQCEAINKHGTILATANVDVLRKYLSFVTTIMFLNYLSLWDKRCPKKVYIVQFWFFLPVPICFLDIRPEILTPDGEEYVSVVGYPSYLHCQHFAVPSPDVSW